MPFIFSVPWNSGELCNAIVEALEEIDASGKDQKRIDKALKELGKINFEASKKKDADKNIKRILKAVKELRKVKTVDISEIRLRLDELLKIWQAKWSLLPGKVEIEDEEEHEEDKGHNDKKVKEEHSSIKRKEPVLVATTGSLTGLLGGVQKVEKLYFYHTDHLGTPILMTDENQNVVWEAEYLPFGEVYSMNGTIENNLRFPGQYFDSETDLHYNWHRYYRAEVGRYIMPDKRPFYYFRNPQSLNKFVYVLNNPTKFKDIQGLQPEQSRKWVWECMLKKPPITDWRAYRLWCYHCAQEALAVCGTSPDPIECLTQRSDKFFKCGACGEDVDWKIEIEAEE